MERKSEIGGVGRPVDQHVRKERRRRGKMPVLEAAEVPMQVTEQRRQIQRIRLREKQLDIGIEEKQPAERRRDQHRADQADRDGQDCAA